MKCNKCGKKVDNKLISHFDSLPPMVGYNYIPPCSRCINCKQPVCKDCMTGMGAFMFVCTYICKDKLEKRLKSTSTSPRRSQSNAKRISR